MEAPLKRRDHKLEQAERFLELAREEARKGYEGGDYRFVRDSAEKTWLAVCEAVNGSMAKHGQSPPVGPEAHGERRTFLEALDEGLAHELSYYADKLHGDCFYSGRCPPKDAMQSDLAKAERFIRRVKALK